MTSQPRDEPGVRKVPFTVAWDDELFPRGDGLALFDLLGSRDKTLHAHPGGHLGIPRTEFGQAGQFLRRHLGGGDSDPISGDSLGALPGACYYVRRSPFARRRAMG